MRRLLFIVLVGLAPIIARADEPKITAPIPRKDIERIFKIIATVTSERILSVDSVLSLEPIPRAIPQETTVSRAGGKFSPTTVYARVDLVTVLTANGKELPMWYKVQKIGETWKIIRRGSMRD